MSFQLDLDTRYDDRREYVPRHGVADEPPTPVEPAGRPEPVEPPVWAGDEHARFINRQRVGEKTQRVDYPSASSFAAVAMPVGEATRKIPYPASFRTPPPLPEPLPEPDLLGRLLIALRSWWSR
jgi:hypothetical protein